MEKGAFNGFSQEPTDFYTVYRNLFTTLDEEEELEEQVGTTHRARPGFGDAESSKEDVYTFYSYWEAFSTLKQFAYVDVYDARQAPNRRIKRLIEADNQKARDKERRKFNDKVRDLLTFCKSKDPRWILFQK